METQNFQKPIIQTLNQTPMEWVRGDSIGHGSFGKVDLAIPRNQIPQIPHFLAVKSCDVSHSSLLMNEKLILDELRGCPHIVHCFGDSFSFENGQNLYNVLLEYASGGSLSDQLNNSCDRSLPESEIRLYTKSILRGLHYVHKNGYVHCDIKLQNILLFLQNGRHDAKLADFGLAKKAGVSREMSGTPLYMSPELVTGGEQEAPADIWAVGCVVVEMVTGSPVWRCADVAGLLMKIGVGDEVPEIPSKLSEEGKDFVRKCFVKDPRKRWTVQMLLDHPFLSDDDVEDHGTILLKDINESPSTSPRCPLDFLEWVSVQSSITCSIASLSSLKSCPKYDVWSQGELNSWESSTISPAIRLRQLITDDRPDWSISYNWETVR